MGWQYRAKLNLHGNPLGKYNAILYALKSVKGVTYENVQANTSSKESLANQITLIRSSTLGWLGVTNPYKPYLFAPS